jgi:predicted CopG family antitoxin
MMHAFNILVMSMVKTITVSDDVYNELLRIKGNKSFSELFRELLRERRGNADALRHIAGILSEDEYKEAKKKIKELEEAFEEWGQSLIQT